ncbi:MAG: hypothetical protein O7F71_01720 [Gammaproteobacteria bacterium]|nr:hypothetical protein [Gammaproteobacteria bacterium]
MSGLLAYSSILLVVSPLFVFALRRSMGWALISALIAAGGLFIPINEVSLIVQLKGVFADLSLTSVTLLISWPLLRVTNNSFNTSELTWLCAVISILALLLYPMALGVGPYDPYILGYQPVVLLTLAAALGIVAVQKKCWMSAATVVVVLLGYWLRVLPSQNLWDYLLDPILVIFAISYLLHRAYRLRIWRRSEGTPRSAEI